MVFINSLKVLFGNIYLALKVLLYKIIALVLSCSIVFSFAYPYFNKMWALGAFSKFDNIVNAGGFRKTTQAIGEALKHFWSVLSAMEGSVKTMFIISVVVLILLSSFLLNLDKIAQTEVIYAKLSSNCKIGYTGSLFKKLGHSMFYSFVKTIYSVIFDAGIFAVFVLSLKLLDKPGVLGIISPFIILLIVVVLVAFVYTLFGGHAISCAVNGHGTLRAWASSVKVSCKKFFKSYVCNFLLVASVVFINYVFGSILMGVFLILTVPASLVFISCMQSVLYFHNIGNRYYVDEKTIITPFKNEFYDKVKNIIDII